jgi:hypothetical protein
MTRQATDLGLSRGLMMCLTPCLSVTCYNAAWLDHRIGLWRFSKRSTMVTIAERRNNPQDKSSMRLLRFA